jgi:hypothetical protein
MTVSVRPLCAVALATLTALSLVVPAGVASAETVRTDDATGDVWQLSGVDRDGEPAWQAVGSVVNTDVVSTVVAHRPRRILFSTRFAGLVRSKDPVVVSYRMRFDGAPPRTVEVIRVTGPRGVSHLQSPRGRWIRCRGLTHEISYATDTITASFPRRCVGDPESFVYSAAVRSFQGWETRRESDDRILFDNPLGPGHSHRDFSEPVTRG